MSTVVGNAEARAAELSIESIRAACSRVWPHAYRTPMLSSRTLSELTGYDVWLKAELFQRTGSFKLRGPLNTLSVLSAEQRAAGVVCSSAGNHAQGVAFAAKALGIPAVIVMAENATPSKVAATRGYGAEVVLHGSIWDEANEHALGIADDRGLTMIHPFDDPDLMAGQGTLGVEIVEDLPDVDVVVVPIGGGGLISGVAVAVKGLKPAARVVGVESSGAPGMQRSVEAGRVVTLDRVDSVIDGLRVKRVGGVALAVVQRTVDEIVMLSDEQIFEAVVWTMARCKLVAEGAAASTVAALLNGRVDAEPGSKVVCVLSGGNLDVQQLAGRTWN